MDSNTLAVVFGLWLFLAIVAFVIGWLAWKFGRLNQSDSEAKGPPLKSAQADISR